MTTGFHSSQRRAARLTVVAAFLTIYLIWGTTFLAIRIAVETIPPFMMAGLRFTLAGGLMLAFLLARGARGPTPRQWRAAAIAGGLMLVGGIGLLSLAEQRIPSGLAGLAVATIPVWMVLLEWLGFGGARPGRRTLAGLGLGLTGAALLFAPEAAAGPGGSDGLGLAIVLLGALIFAAGSVYSRRAPLPADTRLGTAAEMLAGGLLLLLVSLLAGEPAHLTLAAISPRSLAALAYLTIFGSIVGYTAYLWLLKRVEPARVATNFFVNPVVALLAGWLAGDGAVTLPMLGSAAVIVLGVALITTAPPGGRTAD